VINEEEEPTRCYLVFYYSYERLNMFLAALCPSSGAHDCVSDYHMDRLILRLLMEWVLVQLGWLSVRAEGYCSTAAAETQSFAPDDGHSAARNMLSLS
jgi:hypothetical protein